LLGTRERSPDIREKLDGCLLVEVKPLVGGDYLMPPASMPHLGGDVIEPIV
jgi:hypothetical protein